MKRRMLIALFALCCAAVSAGQQTAAAAPDTIHVSDPATWSAEELRPYIGRTVVFDCPIVVCSNASYDLTVSTRRLFTPVNQGAPRSAQYNSVASLNNTGSVSLSGVSGYHRCGEKIYHLHARVSSTREISWVSGEWRGNTRKELEDGIPDLGDYDLLVCGFNIENYFVDHLGKSYLGANSYSEHQKQRAKVSKALIQINADLYGLAELEDGTGALQEITGDLNAALPERRYAYIAGSRQSASQMSGIVYDTEVLEPIGTIQEDDIGVVNRKKMICMREKATGEKFIYSINHFKAKVGTGSGADANQNDGQGAFNATRVKEAQAVLDRYRSYSSNRAIKEKDILIMGDLNAYAKEDPIRRFTDYGMIDLHRAFHADSSYSYQYAGLAGYLDHAISNTTMFPQITGMSGYHINSDERDSYNYQQSSDNSMFRCSDHDPVLVGLKLDSTLNYDPSPTVNTAEIISGKDSVITISNALKEGQHSFYAIYSTGGLLISRQEITSNLQQIEMPVHAGLYVLYIYYDGIVYQRKIVVR